MKKKYLDCGDIGLMPVLVYHFENAKDIYKKYTYKLEYVKAIFSGKQEVYPSMSADFSDILFFPEMEPGKIWPGRTAGFPAQGHRPLEIGSSALCQNEFRLRDLE